MEFTPRIKQILCILLKKEKPIPIKKLAEDMGVSKRTVQRELEYINACLKEEDVQFLSKTGVGVWLKGDADARKKLSDRLSETDNYDGSDREERRKRLILEILRDKGLKKLFYYSSQFKVSEATIRKDLQKAETWLNAHQLYVKTKPGSGVVIEGTEENYRKAIREFISENINTDFLREFYHVREREEGSGEVESFREQKMGKLLNDTVLNRVAETIRKTEDERILNLTENSYVGLILHVSIAIHRILKGELMEPNGQLVQALEKDEDYFLAERIVRALEKEFQTEIPEIEIYYICLHIKASKQQRADWDLIKRQQSKQIEIQKLVNQMIDAFDSECAFLLKQDDEFIQGLLAHLQPTLIRILYGMQIKNPILEEIKESYGDIFEKCRAVSRVLEAWTQKKVPEEETGFLTVHFGAALVRLEERKEHLRQVKIGIVCASGIGVSRLMSSKIEKAFRGRVRVFPFGKGDVTSCTGAKMDFLVSSIELDKAEENVVYVNPLLTQEDMEKIGKLVFAFERTPAGNGKETSFSAELEQVNFIAAQIKRIIRNMRFFEADKDISFTGLVERISEEMADCGSSQEEIHRDLVKREQLGTQVFPEFGFALLHTKTYGVRNPEFAVCVTENREPFSDSSLKQIGAVLIMLLPKDEHIRENTEIFGYLSGVLIEDDSFLNTILQGNREEIRGALSEYLKQYFGRYLNRL